MTGDETRGEAEVRLADAEGAGVEALGHDERLTRGLMTRCPGYDPANVGPTTADEQVELACLGTAIEWHLSPAHPHLFCGCGNEAATCHPTRCCEDVEGGCKNCGREADPEPSPRSLCGAST